MWLEYRDWLFRNIPTMLPSVAFGPFLSFKRSKKDPLVKDQKLRGQLSNWNKYLTGGTHTKDETSRKMSRTGRPAGGAAFVRIVGRLTTCDLSKGKPGSRLKRVSKLVLYLRNSKVQPNLKREKTVEPSGDYSPEGSFDQHPSRIAERALSISSSEISVMLCSFRACSAAFSKISSSDLAQTDQSQLAPSTSLHLRDFSILRTPSCIAQLLNPHVPQV